MAVDTAVLHDAGRHLETLAADAQAIVLLQAEIARLGGLEAAVADATERLAAVERDSAARLDAAEAAHRELTARDRAAVEARVAEAERAVATKNDEAAKAGDAVMAAAQAYDATTRAAADQYATKVKVDAEEAARLSRTEHMTWSEHWQERHAALLGDVVDRENRLAALDAEHAEKAPKLQGLRAEIDVAEKRLAAVKGEIDAIKAKL